MVYTDYKLAAEKHLKTCIGFKDAIDKLQVHDRTSSIITNCKQASIHNLFYLSGYLLESISSYSVYKHFGWNPTKNVKGRDDIFSARCNFSFYSNHHYQYFVEGHQFQTNQFEVLKVPLNNTGIPFIDSAVHVDLDMQVLFNLWKPELRYHDANRSYPFLLNTKITLNETNVLKFITLSTNIYNSLLQIVG